MKEKRESSVRNIWRRLQWEMCGSLMRNIWRESVMWRRGLMKGRWKSSMFIMREIPEREEKRNDWLSEGSSLSSSVWFGSWWSHSVNDGRRVSFLRKRKRERREEKCEKSSHPSIQSDGWCGLTVASGNLAFKRRAWRALPATTLLLQKAPATPGRHGNPIPFLPCLPNWTQQAAPAAASPAATLLHTGRQRPR